MTVIGSDGGLLEAPTQKPYVTLAPAERVEIWVDFSSRAAGEDLSLLSFPLSQPQAGMMGGMGMMGRSGPATSRRPITVLRARIGRGTAVPQSLPSKLATFSPLPMKNAINQASPRVFRVTMGHMRLGLNGRVFEMQDVARDEVVRLGTTEVWEFVNEASMGMMGGMPHPMHVHGVQFRVVGRQVLPNAMAGWREVNEGFVDEGWKDTVLVMSGERVRLLMQFSDYSGMFLYHCHNLEHEDMGMMRNFLIRA